MSLKVIRAAALFAVSAMSFGVVSGPATAKEIDAPPARREVADPAVAQLAADRGVSLVEAKRRLDTQQRAPRLDEALAEALGPARYGGVWIGDDDRIKVGLVEPGTRPAVRAAAAAHQLAGEIDLMPVRHSLAALLAANNWLADRVIQANANADSMMSTGYTMAGNTVQLGLPPEAVEMSPGQRAVLHEARQRYGSMLSTYTLTGPAKPHADCGTENDRLTCDAPPRGSVWISANVTGDDPVCSLGFLARGRSDNKLYAFTSGHCLKGQPAGTVWHTYDQAGTGRITLGTQRDFEYPTNGDAGVIEVTNRQLLEKVAACRCSWVVVLASPDVGGMPGTSRNDRYPILRDGTSTEGMRVCHTGTRSGTSCGRVVRLGVPSSSGVPNLAETNYCAADGDSGGPVYAGNTAYGLHQGGLGFCAGLYQGIRGAENLMNVDVVFDKAPVPGATHFRHNKDQLSPRLYSFTRPDGRLCFYRIRYGDFGDTAYAQVRFYTDLGGCLVSGVEVYGQNFSKVWAETLQAAPFQKDACGAYLEVQATSSPGHSAAGMSVVTPEVNRIFYSHHYTDLPFNNAGPTCP